MSVHNADDRAMRRWVNETLEGHLGLALLHRGAPDAAQHMLTPHEAELRGYVAAGALTAQQAGAWRERFARRTSARATRRGRDDRSGAGSRRSAAR